MQDWMELVTIGYGEPELEAVVIRRTASVVDAAKHD